MGFEAVEVGGGECQQVAGGTGEALRVFDLGPQVVGDAAFRGLTLRWRGPSA
ncbi:MAG: hypothetical protein Q8O34_00785 [Rhodocyclaceae bacterium]|nr:hypothetical protein [Rhodocyclaceae bacterium]